VSGQVREGVTLTATGPGTVTATANYWGEYYLKLGDGTWTITPSIAGWSFYPSSRTVVVNGADQSDVDFTSANCSATPEAVRTWCGVDTAISPAVPRPGDTVTITFTQRSGNPCGGDTSVWLNVPGRFVSYAGGALSNGSVTFPDLPTDPSSAARSVTFQLSSNPADWTRVIRCPTPLGYYQSPGSTTGPYVTVTTGAWHEYVPFSVGE
jgi:hypothetical protein